MVNFTSETIVSSITEYIAVSEAYWKRPFSVPSAITPKSEGNTKAIKRSGNVQSYLVTERPKNKASRLQNNIVFTDFYQRWKSNFSDLISSLIKTILAKNVFDQKCILINVTR